MRRIYLMLKCKVVGRTASDMGNGITKRKVNVLLISTFFYVIYLKKHRIIKVKLHFFLLAVPSCHNIQRNENNSGQQFI